MPERAADARTRKQIIDRGEAPPEGVVRARSDPKTVPLGNRNQGSTAREGLAGSVFVNLEVRGSCQREPRPPGLPTHSPRKRFAVFA